MRERESFPLSEKWQASKQKVSFVKIMQMAQNAYYDESSDARNALKKHQKWWLRFLFEKKQDFLCVYPLLKLSDLGQK